MARVTVIGAGVSGLSTGIRLLEAGHAVTLVAREAPLDTTSAVAAAVWYPFRADPLERVLDWSRAGFLELARLAADPATGVRLRAGREVFRGLVAEPWWRDAVPGLRRVRADELPQGFADGYVMDLPVADMAVYLPWLLARVEALGGTLRRHEVRRLDDLATSGDVVVNCSGLGARALVHDRDLVPIRGQVVRVWAPAVDRFTLHDEDPASLTYVVPRLHHVVLGGTAQVGSVVRSLDPATSASILERCLALEPRLHGAVLLGAAVGLRPSRSSVRLEVDHAHAVPVVHNYGHGGAGVTVSWGCADEVTTLVGELGS